MSGEYHVDSNVIKESSLTSNNKPWVLGLSSSHNGSVCLLRGKEVVVAIQQERLSRLKRHLTIGRHDSLALRYCFDYAGIQPRDLSLVVHSTPDPYNGSPIHDVTLNPYLDVIRDKIPVLTYRTISRMP